MGSSSPGLLRSMEVAKVLRAMLLTSFATACITLVTSWIYNDIYALTASLVGVASLPGLLFLLARGYFTLTTAVFLVVLNTITVFLLCTGGGLHDPGIILFAVVIVASGLLMNRPMAILSACVTLVCAAFVGAAELSGAIQTKFSQFTELNDLINVMTVLGLVTVLVQVLSRAFFRNIERMQITEQSYEQIFNATGEGIVLIDRTSGAFQDVNNALLELLGVSRDELLGRGLDVLKGNTEAYDIHHLRLFLERALQGEPQVFEWATSRQDGSELWLEISLRIVMVQGGQRVLAVLRNVTERRAERQRIQIAEKLQAVGQLAQGVAHDFNNQLTVILANASLLGQKLPPGSPLSTFTEAIEESSRRAAALTQQLLAFARQGRRQSAPVDISVLCENVCELLRRSIDKRIEVQCRVSKVPVHVVGDDVFIQSALLNLGLNARDAMPSGGTIMFSVDVVEGEDPGKKMVRVVVKDTGSGIAPDIRGRIFEPFFTTKETGHGMGLAAVYGTIKAHDGTIEVESEVGVGTTFTVLLPATQPMVESVRVSSETTRSILEGTRVLLAEDELGVADVVVATLRELGCSVRHCKDGAEAMAAIEKDPGAFDVAILDESMPGLTGTEVLIQLRKRQIDVPVISTSGHVKLNTVEGSPRPDLFLPKPFSVIQLSDSLARVLRKS